MRQPKCAPCNAPLSPITVIDQLGNGITRKGLAFTFDEEPQTSGWSGKLKNQAGTIRGFLCESCRRVEFYAD